ncbi:Acyl-CoA synthetase family member 2, mitochondrial [Hypsibius exemplaris]|uniref:Medium-chain acyl-CoA ligase ACSF2, mitochondrial n=1 Tax=Hypsibius exemplaris TaxID=2072580 RepID=A0A9X6RKY2_HYPEX|nr:Acyl-CoA synthetase family member 2, mitochondrial [Hypsibius exemplaris]
MKIAAGRASLITRSHVALKSPATPVLHSSSKRCLHIYIPEKYRTRPARKLTESYIHAASDIPYLATTLARLIDHRAETMGDRVGYVLPFQGVRKTYGQLRVDAEELASGLIALGLKPGDRIGMWGPNSYEWIVTMFAASKAGLILVNVNPHYKVHELEYCINKVQMKCLIAAEGVGNLRYYHHLLKILPELATATDPQVKNKRVPSLESIVMLKAKHPSTFFPGTYAFSDVVAMRTAESSAAMENAARRLQPDDPFNIQFTSGTTGSPKGATLSSFGLINAAYFSAFRSKIGLDSFAMVCPLPLYHVFGCVGNLVLATIMAAKLVLPSEKFEPEAVLKAIQDEKVVTISGVPTMFTDMLHHPNFHQYDLSTLKYGIMGGAPCPPELVKECGQKMGIKSFTCGYGSTEQSLATFAGFVDETPEIFTTTSGYPLDHVEAKVVDGQGRIVPIGEKGELYTRSFGTMLGYWDDDAKTRETIRPDRWMPSGDLATLSEEGLLKIVGRVKDMVIRGGENVYPTEIENVLHTCPIVAEAHVCGIPDQRLGEEVCAWVMLKRGEQVVQTEEYLRDFCKSQLANYKVPRYFVFYSSKADIPMTVSGKIQKFRLTEMAVERLKLSAAV